MTWRTHAAGGIASLWLIAPFPGFMTDTNAGVMAAAAALGALLPDLDAARSKLSAWTVAGTEPLAPLAQTLHGALGHRGLMHSLPGLGLFALLVALPLAFWWGAGPSIALCLGYGSHLALDACTVHGVPLLPTKIKGARGRGMGRWRMGRQYHLLPRPLRVSTGTSAEDSVFFLLALAACVLLLRALI